MGKGMYGSLLRAAGMAALWLFILYVLPAQAHNGKVAIAVPVKGIIVDGDLSDWAEDMVQYPIVLTEYGAQPKDAKDFEGTFQIGYNAKENALYVGVEVRDESTVLDTTAGASWDTQDGCNVYVDVVHKKDDSPPVRYGIWGNTRKVFRGGTWDDVELEVQRAEGTHRYEWRIDIGRASRGEAHLHPGMALGFDVVVCDKDRDGSFSFMAWGRGIEKPLNAKNRGDLVLGGEDGGMGGIRGCLRWEGSREGVARGKMRIQSLESEAFWVQVETDREGQYVVGVPDGRYRLEVIELGRGEQEGATVEVTEGRVVEVELAVKIPRGLVGKVGPGRVVKAGMGIRQGLWQTLGVLDGLPSASVFDILQDRKGHLWFGTERGVSRYDGERFLTFTTKDGLANNNVWTILEDREGHLWFGTERGVSQYDGEVFVTFTKDDGLAGNEVRALLEDRKGHLWFGTEGGGVSRYDGGKFVPFTTQDGLVNNNVWAISEDREGHLWFGTVGGGVSRYDGERFVAFTTQADLAHDTVMSIVEDMEGNLWFGTLGGGLSRYDGKEFVTFTTEDGLADNGLWAILEDRLGHLWFGTRGGVSRYDGEEFVTFTKDDGLAGNEVLSLLRDEEGDLWLGTWGGGVSRYDGERIATFTTSDGLKHNVVYAVVEDRKGHLWFGTKGGGVSRYDGEEFVAFTKDDGLAGNEVWAVVEDRKGRLWFGTMGGGVSRYDGEQFTTFTTTHGLAHNNVACILEDRAGDLWFGTWGGGVSRYDGEQFDVTFTESDGLADNEVLYILEDRLGHLWFGTRGGVSRYDGEQFDTTFTESDGLADNNVLCILEDREGHLWFGTEEGVSRYDGEQFDVTFTADHGLAHNKVTCILEDREGHLWFGTWGGGVSRYDGVVFQHLLKRDGLVHNAIHEILQGRNGDVWIATEGGITRYRSRHTPPYIRLTDVVADHRYGPVSEIRVPTSQEYITFEFQGRSLKTPWNQMAYVVRLEGHDVAWRPTRERRVEYTNLPRGEYVFQVKAVDRDLNYSEVPAEVRLRIHLPYGRIALIGLSAMAMVAAVVASGYAIKRRRERDRARQTLLETQAQLVEEMGKELQVAHDLQMGLMPDASPEIPGLDIAGRCLPANRVGGDYFDYIWMDEKHTNLCVVVADVAGKAMQAAIPVVMFSGMLHTALEHAVSPADLLNHLNRSLPPKLEPRSFICCCVAFLDVRSKRMVLCNAGQPGPLVRRGEHIHTISMETSHWPLGILPGVHYQDMVFDLQEGDVVLFHTDGAIEAHNEAGELYGFDRLEAVLCRGGSPEMDAEGWLEGILEEVHSFSGTASQHDDITLVVLKVGT